MSTETEIKVKIGDPEDFCSRINAFNPRIVSTRHFEDNHLLDFPRKTLQASGCLVRIRHVRMQRGRERAFLTYKGPPAEDGIFKSREELETELDNGGLALEILQRLGMQIWFRYQKYRREFEIQSVIVAVDETPIGNYAEFEGTETGIYALARKTGIETSGFIRLSYYSLYLENCRSRGGTPGNMIFQPGI